MVSIINPVAFPSITGNNNSRWVHCPSTVDDLHTQRVGEGTTRPRPSPSFAVSLPTAAEKRVGHRNTAIAASSFWPLSLRSNFIDDDSIRKYFRLGRSWNVEALRDDCHLADLKLCENLETLFHQLMTAINTFFWIDSFPDTLDVSGTDCWCLSPPITFHFPLSVWNFYIFLCVGILIKLLQYTWPFVFSRLRSHSNFFFQFATRPSLALAFCSVGGKVEDVVGFFSAWASQNPHFCCFAGKWRNSPDGVVSTVATPGLGRWNWQIFETRCSLRSIRLKDLFYLLFIKMNNECGRMAPYFHPNNFKIVLNLTSLTWSNFTLLADI